jgi:hypothetical protein
MRAIQGYCPACGQEDLGHREVPHPDNPARIIGSVFCANPDCLQPAAAHLILEDSEIHHIVRFNPDDTFNVQHPLRERIDSTLLDCLVHTEVQRSHATGAPTEGTWRLKKSSDHNLDTNWVWERL